MRDLLYSDKIPTASLLTHYVDFANAQRGYELIMNQSNDVLKVAITYAPYSALELSKTARTSQPGETRQSARQDPGT